MSLLFKSFCQHFLACFSRLLSNWITTYFQDATCPDLDFISIDTLSKSLSDLRTCEQK